MSSIKRYAVLPALAIIFFIGMTMASLPVNKSGTQASGHPFLKKNQRHQKVPANSLQYQTFKTEIKSLSKKAAAAREKSSVQGLLTGPTPLSAEIERLRSISRGTLSVKYDEKNNLPVFISGSQLQERVSQKSVTGSGTGDELAAGKFLADNRQLLRIKAPELEFRLLEKFKDPYGLTHLRYYQTYMGFEIWGADIVVHLNADGLVDGFNGRYIATPDYLNRDEDGLSEAAALSIAERQLSATADQVSSKKMIFVDKDERARLAWFVNLKSGLAANWMYFIDAGSGELLRSYNHIMTDGPVIGSGLDLMNQSRNLGVYQIGSEFLLIDASKQMHNSGASTLPNDGKGVIYTLDAKNADQGLFFITSSNANSWTIKTGVSASANGALVYDFYHQVYGRNAIDGIGSTMNLVVNFNQNYNNAFWNGQYMVFGNGDGSAFSDLAASLDVTAHEMTHGVIERTANLVYENQPGALNESFADVFGVLFEFWVKGESANWLLGEDVTTPSVAGDALRNMQDPAAANVAFNGQQPTKMSEFQNLPNTPDGDNGGVHINSGIPNRAFYLFATDPAVGIDQAGKVYYQSLTNYLTRNSKFIDCRLAVIRSVDDVFGAGTAEANAAKLAAAQAFDAVEIFDGNNTPPPPVQPPVSGQEYLAITDAVNGILYRYNLQDQNLIPLSAQALLSRPSVTDDGAYIFYVDQNTNVHLVSSDGTSDVTLTESGGFVNVAISRNGRYLAATSVFSEPAIYIFDLEDETGNGDKQLQLYTPTTAEGTTAGNILFPDRIDWSSDDDLLMYDAYNIVVAGGDTTGYWDINLLRSSDGVVGRLFPPQPSGISIGNAVFASNSDNIIAFDYVDESFDVTVFGVNLNSGDIGEITSNFQSLAHPSFSNDDSKIFYHYEDQFGASVWVVDLEEDGITGKQNDQGLIEGGIFPVAFTVGNRPTSLQAEESSIPLAFKLLQNYPNPFNPTTSISYELPSGSDVKLSIHDINGRVIKEMVSENQPAGSHTITWNGTDRTNQMVSSGVYFYSLEVISTKGQHFRQTRKMILLR